MSHRSLLLLTAIVLAIGAQVALAEGPRQRTIAGSMQLDYLAVPTDPRARDQVLDGATVELSLKLAADVTDHTTANVKVCVACHGLEVGMAYFDLRVHDEIGVRVGRFTPSFGSFPIRHDPANHRTSDKPLPYDMGRMLHFRDWNEGILPAPWVDNGLEVYGTRWLSETTRLDFGAFAVTGPKGGAVDFDFDYQLSRTPDRYYVDNNSEPVVGGRVAATVELGASAIEAGASAMAGHYDAAGDLGFVIGGVELGVETPAVVVHAEYLARRTQFAVGADPATRLRYGPGADGQYDDFIVEDGFYVEAVAPFGRLDVIGRWDGLRRDGNVLVGSELAARSRVLRYTVGGAWLLPGALRIKGSVEAYDFVEFDDELAIHLGLAGAF